MITNSRDEHEGPNGDGVFQITRVIDFRVPLWGILSAGGLSVAFLLNMSFVLNTVKDGVAELKAAAKANDNIVTMLSQRVVVLENRADTNDREHTRMLAADVATALACTQQGNGGRK